jgi:hypothetical protein
MTTRIALALVMLLGVTGAFNGLQGCGDKFLVSSRGTRYQHAPAANASAAILIYASPSSPVPKAIATASVVSTLRRAGYRPYLVETPEDFEKALSRGGWDLVLVGVADADAVSRRVKGNGRVLPVVLTSESFRQTRKLYPVVLKGPVKSAVLLDTIADALAYGQRDKSKGV